MLRILNVLAIVVLVGSAVYAYSIKYATLYQAERMTKMKHELQNEKDALAVLRAEWAHVANPVRIETLADQHLGGQVMQLSQIATLATLPDKAARGDEIGAKMQDLGLSEPTATSSKEPKPVAVTQKTTAAPKPGLKTSKIAPAAPKPER
jgi:cell division protein FtsL